MTKTKDTADEDTRIDMSAIAERVVELTDASMRAVAEQVTAGRHLGPAILDELLAARAATLVLVQIAKATEVSEASLKLCEELAQEMAPKVSVMKVDLDAAKGAPTKEPARTDDVCACAVCMLRRSVEASMKTAAANNLPN